MIVSGQHQTPERTAPTMAAVVYTLLCTGTAFDAVLRVPGANSRCGWQKSSSGRECSAIRPRACTRVRHHRRHNKSRLYMYPRAQSLPPSHPGLSSSTHTPSSHGKTRPPLNNRVGFFDIIRNRIAQHPLQPLACYTFKYSNVQILAYHTRLRGARCVPESERLQELSRHTPPSAVGRRVLTHLGGRRRACTKFKIPGTLKCSSTGGHILLKSIEYEVPGSTAVLLHLLMVRMALLSGEYCTYGTHEYPINKDRRTR